MTLDEVRRIHLRWVNDTGVAAKDVLVLCEEVCRLHEESKLLQECLKTIIEAGVTHEQEE